MLIKTEILITTDCYTEGPVRDNHGNIFFTCPAVGEVKIVTAGRASTWATMLRPNGQVILENGDHLVCDSDAGTIYRFSKEGELIGADVKEYCGGNRFSTPNDLVVDKRGGYFFSDSVRIEGSVYYYSREARRTELQHIDYPNGLALSNDGKYLFIAESYQNRILRYELSKGGTASVFCELPFNESGNQIDNLPDGLKIDADGNLWVAHYGMGKIHVIDHEGKVIESIETGFKCCSNLFLCESMCLVSGGYSESGPGGIISIHF